ncbi:hypothetical protein K505DRAFT_202015, partial [Melanomma pulvis-pyrius CBS 109.77]
RDPDVLLHRYHEYLEVFPLKPGERKSQYHLNLLANQRNIFTRGNADHAKAVQYAKAHYWNLHTTKDV